MLKAKYRIPKQEIPRIAKQGKKYTDGLFDVKVWYDNSLTHPLFAVIVSTKIDKRAVVRNTIKRKFRAALFELLKENFFKPANYIFLIKDVKIMDLKSYEIKLMIQNLLK